MGQGRLVAINAAFVLLSQKFVTEISSVAKLSVCLDQLTACSSPDGKMGMAGLDDVCFGHDG